jgi:hypothetical protein
MGVPDRLAGRAAIIDTNRKAVLHEFGHQPRAGVARQRPGGRTGRRFSPPAAVTNALGGALPIHHLVPRPAALFALVPIRLAEQRAPVRRPGRSLEFAD